MAKRPLRFVPNYLQAIGVALVIWPAWSTVSRGQDWGGIDLSGAETFTVQSDKRQPPIRVRDSAALYASGGKLSWVKMLDQGFADISGAFVNASLDVSGHPTVSFDRVTFEGTLPLLGTAGISVAGDASLAAADLRVANRVNISLSEQASLTASFLPAPDVGGNLSVSETGNSRATLSPQGLSYIRADLRDSSQLELSGLITRGVATGPSLKARQNASITLNGGSIDTWVKLAEESELHLSGGQITGFVEGQGDTKLYLHASSVAPQAGGKFQATLLNGGQAVVSLRDPIVNDFLGQTFVVDAAGKQTAIDTDLRFNPVNGHFYKSISTEAIDWPTAEARAEQLSFHGPGHLVTITSEQESQFLVDQFALNQADIRGLWIGASDAAEEGVWKWVVGPEAGEVFYRGGCGSLGCNDQVTQFADWVRGAASGTPDQPSGGVGENYVLWQTYARQPRDTTGRWHDYPIDAQAPGFLVEFEPLLGDASGNGIVGLEDFELVKRNFGAFGSFAEGDFNGSWRVDLDDFALLKQNFGRATLPAPEPPSCILLLAGALAALNYQCRHQRLWSPRH